MVGTRLFRESLSSTQRLTCLVVLFKGRYRGYFFLQSYDEKLVDWRHKIHSFISDVCLYEGPREHMQRW